MSVLSTIRKNSWLILALIGLALIGLFLSDLLNRSGINDTSNLGAVNNDKISIKDYNKTFAMLSSQQQGQPDIVLQKQVWDILVEEKLLYQQLDKLGIAPAEGSKQYYSTLQTILGQLGVKETINSENYNQIKAKYVKGNNDLEQYFIVAEQRAKIMVLQESYFGLLQQGILVTDKEIDFEYNYAQKTANIDYAYIPYSSYAGGKNIKISDSQIQDYINDHTDDFKKEESRDINYVLLDGGASNKDKTIVREELAKYINDFKEKNPVSGEIENVTGFSKVTNYKEFVNNYSDVSFSDNLIFEEQMPAEMSSKLKQATVNSVVGPYDIQNNVVLSRVIEKKTIQDSTQLSQILISHVEAQQPQGNTTLSRTKAKAKADSLLAVLKSNPSMFAEIAKKNSDDPSRLNGGNAGWVKYQDLLNGNPKIKDFVINSAVNNITMIENPATGYMILKIDNKKSPKNTYLLANVVKKLNPSKQTTDSVSKIARKITEDFNNKTIAEINQIAKKNKVSISNENGIEQFNIQGSQFAKLLSTGNQDAVGKILSWAFDQNTETKSSELFSLDNNNQIIAYVANKYDAGLALPSQVRQQVEPILKNKEIAKAIIQKIGKQRDLKTISSTFGVMVANVPNFNFVNPTIVGVGREDVAAGGAFSNKVGQTSRPLEGRGGVIIVKTNAINTAETTIDKKTFQQELLRNNRQSALNAVLKVLKQKADIEDKRSNNPYLTKSF